MRYKQDNRDPDRLRDEWLERKRLEREYPLPEDYSVAFIPKRPDTGA